MFVKVNIEAEYIAPPFMSPLDDELVLFVILRLEKFILELLAV